MLYKNHRARCSNNKIKLSIQLMTLLTEMIPGKHMCENTKRSHSKKKKKKKKPKTINRTKLKNKFNKGNHIYLRQIHL